VQAECESGARVYRGSRALARRAIYSVSHAFARSLISVIPVVNLEATCLLKSTSQLERLDNTTCRHEEGRPKAALFAGKAAADYLPSGICQIPLECVAAKSTCLQPAAPPVHVGTREEGWISRCITS
jgi:hypothetical protein